MLSHWATMNWMSNVITVILLDTVLEPLKDSLQYGTIEKVVNNVVNK